VQGSASSISCAAALLIGAEDATGTAFAVDAAALNLHRIMQRIHGVGHEVGRQHVPIDITYLE